MTHFSWGYLKFYQWLHTIKSIFEILMHQNHNVTLRIVFIYPFYFCVDFHIFLTVYACASIKQTNVWCVWIFFSFYEVIKTIFVVLLCVLCLFRFLSLVNWCVGVLFYLLVNEYDLCFFYDLFLRLPPLWLWWAHWIW